MTWADDLLNEIDTADDEHALFERVQQAAKQLGFDYCAYGMRVPVPVTNPRTLMLNNYPVAWQERYVEQKYLGIDPTVRLGAESQQPILWGDDVFAETPQLWDDARDAGMPGCGSAGRSQPLRA
ncbi:MAG: autoinducer binding domain-containing protein [Alcaligenes sp.]